MSPEHPDARATDIKPGSKPKLVVIDDDPVFRHQVKVMASPQFAVYDFEGPLHADEKLLIDADYIVLDLSMPDVDGLAFIKVLASLNRRTKLLIISGHDQHVIELARQTATLFGIESSEFLHKPVSSVQFFAALDALARLAELSIRPVTHLHRIASDSLDIENGIAAGEFTAFYQPQINIESGKVIGLEALARWQHPDYGLLLPGSFIDSIENSSLCKDFTLLMVEIAIVDYAKTVRIKDPSITVSVNVPPEALKCPDFAEQVIQLLDRYHCPAHQLVCEITERGTEELNANASYAIAKLKMAGIQMAIDDFGTGQSGLNKLKTHAYNEIKIDRSFIKDLPESKDSQEIVKSVIDLARQIGLRVVAEGVETQEVLQVLKIMHCEAVQGFLLSRPMTITQFSNWFEQYSPVSDLAIRSAQEAGAMQNNIRQTL